MDCGQVDLIGYHFGVTDEAVRDEAEAHLQACATCLASYLALKRHLDLPRADQPRPSDQARARLRRAVGQRFGKPRGVRAVLTRPIPLYQGLAAAAFALLCATLAPELARSHHEASPYVTANEPPVDTARTTAASVGVY